MSTAATITINEAQQLFVIHGANSCSCLGFDVAAARIREYARKLGRIIPDVVRGSMAQFETFSQLERAYIDTKPQETQFAAGTPVEIQAILEHYRNSGTRIRVFLGDELTGRDWLSESDNIGKVGRSMGPLKTALLVPAGDNGGAALLSANIVRIIETRTGKETYRHPGYHLPKLTVVQRRDADDQALEGKKQRAVVLADGELHAAFSTFPHAERFVEFLSGIRHSL